MRRKSLVRGAIVAAIFNASTMLMACGYGPMPAPVSTDEQPVAMVSEEELEELGLSDYIPEAEINEVM